MEKGFWARQKFVLSKIAEEFDVHYYTGDLKSFQHEMPKGVVHKVSPFNLPVYGISHIIFYLYLIFSSVSWKQEYILRVWGTSIPVLGIIKTIAKVKVVVSYQYDWASGVKKDYRGIKTWVADWVQQSVMDSADGVICTMEWLKDVLKQKYNKENVVLIPNFVNTDEFYPGPIKKNIVVFSGRLHWSKGVDVLIEAFKKFHLQNSSWKLYIVGDGEEKERLKKQSGPYTEEIVFLGRLPYNKVAECLNESKIFVLPTKTMEGHPKSLVEAMASGCISIASNVPGNKDTLSDSGSSELMFESGDIEDLLHKLELAVAYNQEGYKIQYEFATSFYSHRVLIPRELSFLNTFVNK